MRSYILSCAWIDDVTNDGEGDITTTQQNASGVKTSDIWEDSDGSFGNDTFNANGSSSGTTTNADGSRSTYTNNGQGAIVTTYFNAAGTQTSQSTQSTIVNADGSTTSYSNDGLGNIETIQYNASGVETSDTWQKSDGSSGTDTRFGNFPRRKFGDIVERNIALLM